jgi:hypothetical protein
MAQKSRLNIIADEVDARAKAPKAKPAPASDWAMPEAMSKQANPEKLGKFMANNPFRKK